MTAAWGVLALALAAGPDPAAARDLVRALEEFQAVLVDEVGDPADRGLYRRADAALAAAGRFLDAAAPFDDLDRAVAALLEPDPAAARPALRWAARRVREAFARVRDEAGVPAAGRTLREDAEALRAEAEALGRAALYSLGAGPEGTVLNADLRALAREAEQLVRASADADPRTLAQAVRELERTWAQVAGELRELSSATQAFLFRRAARVERLVHAVHRRLGLPGVPAQLGVRA